MARTVTEVKAELAALELEEQWVQAKKDADSAAEQKRNELAQLIARTTDVETIRDLANQLADVRPEYPNELRVALREQRRAFRELRSARDPEVEDGDATVRPETVESSAASQSVGAGQ